MPTQFREVLYNDGEGLDFNDFNNAQRYARAEYLDGILRARCRTVLGNTVGATSYCYAFGFGGNVKSTATNLRSSNYAGSIVQLISAGPSATDPTALVYYLSDDELQTDHDAADPTNPRYDIICVKLEMLAGDSTSRDFEDAATRALSSTTPDKTRKVTLTKQVVKGTPAATPAEPAVPAGFVKWASVKIPATFATTFTAVTHFRDYRVPIGGLYEFNLGPELYYAGSFAGAADPFYLRASAAAQAALVKMPMAGRLVRMVLRTKITSPGSLKLYRFSGLTGSSEPSTLVYDGGHTSGVESSVTLYDITSPPLWTRGGAGVGDAEADAALALLVESGANGDLFGQVQIEIATL